MSELATHQDVNKCDTLDTYLATAVRHTCTMQPIPQQLQTLLQIKQSCTPTRAYGALLYTWYDVDVINFSRSPLQADCKNEERYCLIIMVAFEANHGIHTDSKSEVVRFAVITAVLLAHNAYNTQNTLAVAAAERHTLATMWSRTKNKNLKAIRRHKKGFITHTTQYLQHRAGGTVCQVAWLVRDSVDGQRARAPLNEHKITIKHTQQYPMALVQRVSFGLIN